MQRTAADIGCELKVWGRYEHWCETHHFDVARDWADLDDARRAGRWYRSPLKQRLEKEERRSAGLALLAVGVLTTVPILMRLRDELK